MGSGYHNGDKGLFSHHRLGGGGGHYPPPNVGYAYPAYPPSGYPNSHAGYPPNVYPPPSGYPPVAYPYHASSAPYYPGHGGHKHGVGTFLAGGAAAVAASYGAHHMPHYGYGYHGHHHHHHHHGKFKHYKFKRAKFGKRWKHGGRHKMWK